MDTILEVVGVYGTPVALVMILAGACSGALGILSNSVREQRLFPGVGLALIVGGGVLDVFVIVVLCQGVFRHALSVAL